MFLKTFLFLPKMFLNVLEFDIQLFVITLLIRHMCRYLDLTLYALIFSSICNAIHPSMFAWLGPSGFYLLVFMNLVFDPTCIVTGGLETFLELIYLHSFVGVLVCWLCVRSIGLFKSQIHPVPCTESVAVPIHHLTSIDDLPSPVFPTYTIYLLTVFLLSRYLHYVIWLRYNHYCCFICVHGHACSSHRVPTYSWKSLSHLLDIFLYACQ